MITDYGRSRGHRLQIFSADSPSEAVWLRQRVAELEAALAFYALAEWDSMSSAVYADAGKVAAKAMGTAALAKAEAALEEPSDAK